MGRGVRKYGDMNSISELSIVSPYFVIIPPLEKGGEGGLEKTNKERRDRELPTIYKISPDPSLLKRGTQLVPDIFIIPLWKRGTYFPPFFHHTIRYRAPYFLITSRVNLHQ